MSEISQIYLLGSKVTMHILNKVLRCKPHSSKAIEFCWAEMLIMCCFSLRSLCCVVCKWTYIGHHPDPGGWVTLVGGGVGGGVGG